MSVSNRPTDSGAAGQRLSPEVIWQETVETFRKQIELLVQWSSLLLVANVTLIGYAASIRSAGVLAVGAGLSAVIVQMLTRFETHARPVIYTALQIEHEHKTVGVDGLATTYTALLGGGQYLDQLKDAVSNPTYQARLNALSEVEPSYIFGRRQLRGPLYLAVIGHPLVAVILVVWFDWSVF